MIVVNILSFQGRLWWILYHKLAILVFLCVQKCEKEVSPENHVLFSICNDFSRPINGISSCAMYDHDKDR